MIGIFQNSYFSEIKVKDLLETHCDRIIETIGHIQYRKDENSKSISGADLIDEINRLISPLSLSDIVQWDYEKIVKKIEDPGFISANQTIKKLCGYSIKSKDSSGKYKKSKELLFSERIYTKFRNLYGKSFVEDLNITVCPYCNRNYINSGNNVTMAQLDHFFPKSKYPLLAISFFNLVPCCYACNHIKSDGECKDRKFEHVKMISPFDKSKKTDSIVKFSYLPKLHGRYPIEVRGCGIFKEEMEKNIAVFQLEEQYRIHSDIIDELHIKVESESPEYLEAIRKLMKKEGDLSYLSEEEIYFGNYLTQDKYYLRPLSKFEHDIINQIKGKDTI